MKTIKGAALIAVVALAVSACSSESVTSPAPTETASESPAPEAFEPIDVTEAIKADSSNAELIIKATQTEPLRIEIETSIIDPATDDSLEAMQAGEICGAGVRALNRVDGAYVAVKESDGTYFVIAGHPAMGPECAEV